MLTLKNEKIAFQDSTDFLKQIADKEFIHGLKDPKHFNQKGYEFVSLTVMVDNG